MKQTKPHPSKVASNENATLQMAMMQMVDAQLRGNSPPETKKTYERLMKEGFSDAQAREMIATAMAKEISQILKKPQPFDHARFTANLDRLPKSPKDK